ncbi:MAG TPA: four helix bundle protein [Methylomirabilota bacterium]|nr:four helix bundle protein [Methylomirabilota bacterium]
MATFQTFEEIEGWQMARRLSFEIYSASKKSSFAKDVGLQKQIRDASVSIMATIAEGFERSGSGEFQQFLAIAKGSAGEVISHLYVALDQGYINHEEFRRLEQIARDTGRKIGGLMSYLCQSDLRGPKYKTSTRRQSNSKRLEPNAGRETRDSKRQ